MNENERDFFISKDTLDTVNSFAWFMMDATWMLEMKQVATAMILPTLLSGVFLCYIEKRKSVALINLSLVCWIIMNVSWMFSESYYEQAFMAVAKVSFLTGLVLIATAAYYSKNMSDTFSHFKRFRIKTYFR